MILLSQIKNGKASTDDLKRSRSVLFGFSMVYFVIGLLMMLLMWFLESLSRNSGLQIATILFFTVGVVVFIISRIFVYIKAKPIDILPMVVPYQHVLLPWWDFTMIFYLSFISNTTYKLVFKWLFCMNNPYWFYDN